MSRPPHGLSPEEKALWARLASTVKPLERRFPPRTGQGDHRKDGGGTLAGDPVPRPIAQPPLPVRPATGGPAPRPREDRSATAGLDSHWERKLARADIAPDFTLDLHGHTLDQAHHRLESGLAQARAMGARLVLVITGKARPVDAADRGSARGAIRAKILDWLAAGPHQDDIAAVRKAHRRHGGEGAIYLVLRRRN